MLPPHLKSRKDRGEDMSSRVATMSATPSAAAPDRRAKSAYDLGVVANPVDDPPPPTATFRATSTAAGLDDDGSSSSLFPPALPYVLGFFSAMVLHELALEAATASYGDYDSLASCVTLFQFGFCVLLPLAASRGRALSDFPRTPAGCLPYAKLSVLVYGATALASRSLAFPGVTYVTKVVFKSAKLIPTMIVSVALDGDRGKYNAGDYASAALLCAGAAGFCFGSGDDGGRGDAKAGGGSGGGGNAIDDAVSRDGRTHWMGIALLTASVFCDAFVPNLQERLMKRKPTPPSLPLNSINEKESEMKSLFGKNDGRDQNDGPPGSDTTITKIGVGLSASSLMVNVNAVGFVCLLISMTVYGSLFESIRFVSLRPRLLLYLLVVGCGLGSAVLAYTELIRRSGPAAAVAVATLRKVATIILSYIFFPKALTLVHAISGMAIIGGMVLGFSARGRR